MNDITYEQKLDAIAYDWWVKFYVLFGKNEVDIIDLSWVMGELPPSMGKAYYNMRYDTNDRNTKIKVSEEFLKKFNEGEK